MGEVSYTSSDVQKDDSHTGRGRVERCRRDLCLRHCSCVAVEQKFTTDYKKVKFSHTRYRALGPELIPVYRQSARR